MVDEGPSQWDDFLHNGEGISNDVEAWNKEQNLSSFAKAKIEAEKKAKSKAEDKRHKEMCEYNLSQLKTDEEKKKKTLAYTNMLTGLAKYISLTSHITFPATNISDQKQGLVDGMKERRAWIIKKHKEWENRYGKFNLLLYHKTSYK